MSRRCADRGRFCKFATDKVQFKCANRFLSFLQGAGTMKRNLSPQSSLSVLALALLALCLAPAPAHAYIDPGTGSFVIQGLIAAVVGAGFALKVFWKRIVAAITGKSAVEDDDDL